MRTYTTEAFCRKAGITYRIADYWDRQAVLVPSCAPADGSGTRRLYSDDDVAVGTVLGRLGRLGANRHVLRVVADALRARPQIDWPVRVYVTADGVMALTASGLEDGGWVVPTRAEIAVLTSAVA